MNELKSNMRWLAVSMSATLLLMFPLRSGAQSKSASEEIKVAVPAFRTNASKPAHNSGTPAGTQTKTIRIWDACDPVTFDAKVGPGTCIAGHHGQTIFDDFFAEVQQDQVAGGWRFNPLLNTTDGIFKLVRLELAPGDRISLENVGGETHTFTKVEEFGGGFFAPLNPLTGNPEPAPECARVLADGSLAPQPESDTNQFVEAGETEFGPIAGTRALPLGVTHWQCCIHPWMRTNVAVRDRDQDHEHEHQN